MQSCSAQGCLKYFWNVKVTDRYYAKNDASGPTFTRFCHFAFLAELWLALRNFTKKFADIFTCCLHYFDNILLLTFGRYFSYFAGNLNILLILPEILIFFLNLPAPIWNSILHFRFPCQCVGVGV